MIYTTRIATKKDVAGILNLITDLAVFENEPEAVIITEADLLKDGFGDAPLFTCFVAEKNNEIIAIALFYTRYSTWKGRAIHLEDLIVKEEHRGNGVGTLLLNKVIQYGHDIGVKRISWEVLDWNTPAIQFYESKGAALLKDWFLVQMDQNSIKNYLNKLK